MLDWLKKLGGRPSEEAPGELSEEQRRRLAEDLASLDRVGAGLAKRAVLYVDTGGGEEILADLAGLDPKGPQPVPLRCISSFYQTPPERGALLASLNAWPPRALHRLGLVWEASSRPRSRVMNLQGDGIPGWMEILIQESTGLSPNVFSSAMPGLIDLGVLEETLAVAGEPRELIARALLQSDPKFWSYNWNTCLLKAIPGWGPALARHPDPVRRVLARKESERRVHALEVILESEADPEPFAAEIAELAAGSSKKVRELAGSLAGKIPTAVRPGLEAKAAAGSAEERLEAVTLLGRLAPGESEGFLRRRLKEEKSEKVKAGLREILAVQETAPAEETAGPEFDLPPLRPVDLETPPGPEIRRALEECYPAPTQVQIDTLFDGLQTMTWDRPVSKNLMPMGDAAIERFLSHPALRLVHAVRFMMMNGLLARKHWNVWLVFNQLGTFFRKHPPGFSLMELVEVFRAVGLTEANIYSMVLDRVSWMTVDFEFRPEQVWPFFAGRPEALGKALSATDSLGDDRRRNALEILATFPRAPRRLAPRVWDLALNGTKKERPLAQAVLEREPDRVERLVAALAGPKSETRAVAAEWLGWVGDASAIPALRTALAKEKQEATVGSLMLALERLGVPPAEIVDLDGLLAEARKGLKKGFPTGLSWLGMETLPTVRWRESGEPVEGEVLQWLLAQSHKLGSPEPGPRLRYLASLFRPEDAGELGQYVLDSWIAWDTLGHTPDEAEAHARQAAPQHYQMSLRYPEYYRQQSEEEYYRQFYNAKLVEPRGSAIKDKGILAVAGACCGGRAAASVERYLKRWYGMRAAHCRALLQMLSWVEHRAAAQVLLATSARFRTAGIRQEAERLVQALAERKGWTVDQLADRTIPTAGFDERCELELDYGGRAFKARLGEDWSVVLLNEEGKEIKALPEPRQGDDEARVKEAKKALAAAKKEIQAILRLQRERLYEAMCTQRPWSFEDWDEFLHAHPIVRRYCERLVWSAWDGETLTATFRPLEDGSLTDAGDSEVTVAPEAEVRLAHAAVLPPEVVEAWRRHLADYQVQTLFEQLGEPWRLPAELREARDLEEFKGHLLEAFALRGRATKLGYTRGQAEDGGVFSVYRKHFPGLGLTAAIEFTGNQLPETNRTVALTALSFQRGESPFGLPLREVPPVLLSECRNDLASIAAQGSGYDPDWEKKIPW
jgi:hypothetical protein